MERHTLQVQQLTTKKLDSFKEGDLEKNLTLLKDSGALSSFPFDLKARVTGRMLFLKFEHVLSLAKTAKKAGNQVAKTKTKRNVD